MSDPVLAQRVDITAKYHKGEVDVYMTGYHHDLRQPAMLLTLPDSIEQACIASVMMDGKSDALEDQEIFLKGWAENEGIPDALVAAGVVTGPRRSLTLYYGSHEVHTGIYKLNDECYEAWQTFLTRLKN